MNIRILGPLEVESDGRRVALGPKQQTLLAILLVNRGRSVSADRLADELYESRTPKDAIKTLQVHVSRLRKALGDSASLTTVGGGYRLTLDADDLDAERFESLADAGRTKLVEGEPHPASALLDEALALWRGPPLAEFAFADFAQGEIARLEERRLSALEDRNDAELAAWRHASLVGELEALVRQHPLRERLRAQLMLAQYRSGRQAEALGAYQEARRVLVDELGIEPGRPLRELQQAILAQDPSLDLERSEERRAPSPPAARAVSEAHDEIEGREERKTVTVLHALVRVASEVAGVLDPELLRKLTSAAFGEIVSAIEAHEGTIEAVSGDSVTGVFGLPLLHEDDTVRAHRSAEEIGARLAPSRSKAVGDSDVDVRVGVATGVVMTGLGSGPLARVTGEPIIVASRLAQHALPGEIVLDEATRRGLRAADRDQSRFTSPMVGREREQRRLVDAFEQAVSDRSCQLFTVLGAAGVGKSRLVAEFLEQLGPDVLVARGRCLPYGEGITFWPLLEAIRDAVGLTDTDSPEESVAKIADVVGEGPDAERVAREIAEIIGLADAGISVEDVSVPVRAFFEGLATDRSLVLVFDDIHWGEETFLELIEYITDGLRDAPVLLVCLARPELLDVLPHWGGGRMNATSVLLQPLSIDESRVFIEHLVGSGKLMTQLELVAVQADGIPLFVEEMLAMLIDDGVLVREGGRWATTADPGAVAMPPTIGALLSARLDRLSRDERTIIECAAIEGKIFHEDAVEELVPEGLRNQVEQHFASLTRKELIRTARADFSGTLGFRFRHLLIRDAAYNAIPKLARAGLHERFARWLGRRAGEGPSGYEEIIGYHLEQAVTYRAELGTVDDATVELGREAAERLGGAGKRAFVRRDAQAAISLMSRAVALLPHDDPGRVQLVPNVRVVQGLGGDLTWADRVLSDAVMAARAAGDSRLEAHALVQRAFLQLFTNPEVTAQELQDVADRTISIFDGFSDELGLVRAWRLKAQAHYLDRHAGPCVDASEHAFEHARRSGDLLERREVVEWLCVALMLGPTPASQGAERCERLLAEVEKDSILGPTVVSVLGNMYAMLGRVGEAESLLARFRRSVAELDETIWLFAINFGFLALADDPVAAERELRPGYEALQRIGEQSHFSSVAALLARTLCAQGRYEEAYALTFQSEAAARANDIHSHILWRSTRAKVLARTGELAEAEALAREAVRFAAGTDFVDSHADTLMDLAEVLTLSGRASEASALIGDAIELYEQKENVLSAARARTLRRTP